jgi:hypothetical protein
MDAQEIGQLVAFLLLISIPLVFLEIGMRRVRRQRRERERP